MDWRPDTRPLRIATPDGAAEVSDPFSHWALGPGRAFRFTRGLKKVAPDDFEWVAHCPRTDWPALDAVRLFPLAKATGKPGNPGGLFAPLPLRAGAVANSAPTPPVYAPAPGVTPERLVIVGVIDDGINVFNRRFRPHGHPSRVEYAWVQDAPAPGAPTVPYGSELMREAITAAIDTGAGDAALMRAHGLTGDPSGPYRPTLLSRPLSHGTHVADLAGGAGPDDAGALDTRLITVQLPALATLDTSGLELTAPIQHAAAYVFERALMISRHHGVAVPVVLNLSYGALAGALEGRSQLVRAIAGHAARYRAATEAFAGQAAAVRVLPAGNDHPSEAQALALPEAPGLLDLPLRVQPDDRTSSFLDVWADGTCGDLRVTITPPGGKTFTARLPVASTGRPSAYVLKAGADVIARLSLDAPDGADAARNLRLVLALAPTRRVAGRAAAPAGLWRVAVRASGARLPLLARVLRDDTLAGFAPVGRQAYFDWPVPVRYGPRGAPRLYDPDPRPCAGTLNASLSELATDAPRTDGLPLTVAVGGATWATGGAAPYSAAGLPGGQAPAALATSDASLVAKGVLATATLSGARLPMGGTSVAAPQVTRRLAAALSEMGPKARAEFDPALVLARAGDPPLRPSPQDPENWGSASVRLERLKEGGVVLGGADEGPARRVRSRKAAPEGTV